MKKRNKLRGLWLMALGAVLIAAALVGLNRQRPVLQYSIVAPTEAAVDISSGAEIPPSELAALKKTWAKLFEEELMSAVSASAVSARDFGFSAVSDRQGTANATLTAVSENWFRVYPQYLASGRLMGDAELKDGARVAVLDEELAFKLFPTSDPLEGKVLVGETWYRVIGTVRRDRGVGDFERLALYIPLARAAEERLQFETVEAAGVPIPKSGAPRAFVETAERWAEGGTFVDSDKEIMRATMLLRVLAILFGFYVLLSFMRRLNTRVKRTAGGYGARLHTEYFRRMLPEILRASLVFLLGYAALIGAGYALLSLAIAPMYVFTEWIPDVLVEMSSITGRFWQLTSAAAKPVAVRTREFSEIRFWAGVLRWGTIALISGFVVLLSGRARNLQRPGA